ncbi:WAP four-disulfide core domain protein 2 isoform X2 [Harpegnathos saltator]|uniref:WAP four-disulfide core domain protein 2 isoform X2 n=1 Tax=Harpegnathos saltator TaxID=610380 RepID=UPI00059174AA|nr:WAP four-disulfide core domain protein 2 isoform X2 [Harpegnathos saltator]
MCFSPPSRNCALSSASQGCKQLSETVEKMKLLIVCLIFAAAISIATSQNEYIAKPGSCPPALPVQFCGHSCLVDSHCAGIGKCCPTQCGGSICSMPVTMSRPLQSEKPGTCPSVPTGRWVCTSTCNSDSDCRGNLKCCKNRCGALACQKPEIEVVESIGIPVEPVAPRFGYDY